MKPSTQQATHKTGLELASDALHLLRTAPPRALPLYMIGALPFVLGLLYFWADMSRSAFARERCFPAALIMALLFIWMKTWQALFAAELRCHLAGNPARARTAREFVRLTLAQAILQPYGLVIIPASLLLLMPFFTVYAFYQNLTVLGERETADLRSLVRKAWGFALHRPTQNHILVWLLCPWVLATGLLTAFGTMRLAVSLSPELYGMQGPLWFAGALALTYYFVLPISPFGCVVAGNIGLTLILLPLLLRALFGLESTLTLSGWHAIFNSTYLMTVFAFSYLCLDPVIKAAYCLRCFYAESETTGEDLIVGLRNEP